MATVEHIEPGVIRVSGEYDTVYVLSVYREYGPTVFEVINTNEHVYGTVETVELGIELASEFADTADEYAEDDEIGDGMTDAEADADVLASAGYGTDEDYGGRGDYDDCFDYDAFGDAF